MGYLFKVYVLGMIFVLPMLAQSIIEGGADYLVEHYLEILVQPNTSSGSTNDSLKLSQQMDEIFESTK